MYNIEDTEIMEILETAILKGILILNFDILKNVQSVLFIQL